MGRYSFREIRTRTTVRSTFVTSRNGECCGPASGGRSTGNGTARWFPRFRFYPILTAWYFAIHTSHITATVCIRNIQFSSIRLGATMAENDVGSSVQRRDARAVLRFFIPVRYLPAVIASTSAMKANEKLPVLAPFEERRKFTRNLAEQVVQATICQKSRSGCTGKAIPA